MGMHACQVAAFGYPGRSESAHWKSQEVLFLASSAKQQQAPSSSSLSLSESKEMQTNTTQPDDDSLVIDLSRVQCVR
jgi:hypothetical protein